MTLRTKLFLGVNGLIVFFVLLSLLLNSQFLSSYYLWEKRASLIKSKDEINNLYHGDPELISLELEGLERNTGITVNILSPESGLKYSSSFRTFKARFGEILPAERLRVSPTMLLMIKGLDIGDSVIEETTDPRLKTNFLTLASRLKNSDLLILSTPVAAINESTSVANRFFMFTGLLTIVLGGLVVFIYAKRFTRPILELSDIAQRMATLDFTKKYAVRSGDEVGQLGNSINSLSDQLDKAISDLTEVNNKLMADIERERRIDKMRKEFVSNVSHELKTPIALIQGYAEGLKLNVNEDEENRNFYCDVIMDETDKMNRLVRDLLDLSQIESGSFKLERSNFNISLLVEYSLVKFRPVLSERGIKVSVEKDDNATVNGDYARIEQVLVNYLNNAINHVDENRLIRIAVTKRDDKVRVSVFNSGENIPKEALEKIWTSFFKVDKARTRAYGGTGLGLSVVKSVLQLHQNSYGVENQKDGVLFWFELDRA